MGRGHLAAEAMAGLDHLLRDDPVDVGRLPFLASSRRATDNDGRPSRSAVRLTVADALAANQTTLLSSLGMRVKGQHKFAVLRQRLQDSDRRGPAASPTTLYSVPRDATLRSKSSMLAQETMSPGTQFPIARDSPMSVSGRSG
jgi:hypothetical protein